VGTGTPPVTTAPVATTPVTTTPVTTAPAQPALPTTPVTTTPATPPAEAAQATPQAPARALAVKVALKQSGKRVRGSVTGVRAAGTIRIGLSARLKGTKATAVGSLRARAGATGALTFSVPLSAAAQKASRKRALTITARLTAPNAAGVSVVRTFRIAVRATASAKVAASTGNGY
jgi:hypothetical protein